MGGVERVWGSVWLAVALVASGGNAEAASFVHGSSRMSSTARDSNVAQNSQSSFLEPGAFSLTQNASQGDNHLTTRVRFDGGRFDVRWDHERGETASGLILPSTNTTLDIRFTVDEDTTYAAEGLFSAQDPRGKRLWYQVFLRVVGGPILFWSEQDSQNLADPELVLGGSGNLGGPFDDFWYTGRLIGALQGNLVAGEQYQLWVQATASDMLYDEPTVTLATGHFSLVALPEPGTAVLLGGGLAVLAGRRRRTQPWSSAPGHLDPTSAFPSTRAIRRA